MSECAEYNIIYFEEEILQIKEILEISLNIIFFHRFLGNGKFYDVQSRLNNISYVKLKSEKLSNNINKIINGIENNFRNNNNYGQKLSLSFSEKDKNPWEIWNFLLILSKKEDLKEKSELNNKNDEFKYDQESKIREYIFKIIEKLNDKGNYMPNINLEDKSLKEETFSYSFKIDTLTTKEDLFNYIVKKNQENVIRFDGLH